LAFYERSLAGIFIRILDCIGGKVIHISGRMKEGPKHGTIGFEEKKGVPSERWHPFMESSDENRENPCGL
jgi:hypothetical protein